jgi:hypothetical protein
MPIYFLLSKWVLLSAGRIQPTLKSILSSERDALFIMRQQAVLELRSRRLRHPAHFFTNGPGSTDGVVTTIYSPPSLMGAGGLTYRDHRPRP